MNPRLLLLWTAALVAGVPVLVQAQQPNIHLKDGRWDIVLNAERTPDGRLEGRYVYTVQNSRHTVCRGSLSQADGAALGSLRFAERLESGNCVRGCTLILTNGLQDYEEVCGRRVAEAGRLDVLEGGDLVAALVDRSTPGRPSSIGVAGAGSPLAPANTTFQLKSESISNFATMFDKACTAPAKYRSIKADFANTARSADAKVNQLVHPQRTVFHVVGTDLAAYETYYPNACERLTRMSQCLPGKVLSAEEACDCAAGYMGDVKTGVGAGELITSSNHAIGTRSCQIAADRASGTLKARYLAQLGRAQLYDRAGTSEGAATLKQAIAAGYRRGEVDLARASLRDVEFGGLSLDNLGVAMKHLALGRAAGARDTGSVIEAIDQVARVKQWNADVFGTWTRLTQSTGSSGSTDMDAEAEAARRAAERQGRPQESRPLPAPTPPIGGSNGLYGCASPPCM